MKKSRYKEEQIVGFLKEAEAGFPIADSCHQSAYQRNITYTIKRQYEDV